MKQKLPIYYQSERSECGLVCLAMLISYYGHHIDMIEIRSKFKSSTNGLTLEQLIEIASVYNLSTRPVRLELDNIKDLSLPCILHWKLNHFVVLKSISANGAIIHDPSDGLRKVSYNELNNCFTGIALEAVPSNSFEKRKVRPKFSLQQLWSEIKGIKRIMTKIFILSLFAQLFTLVTPYYIQSIVDLAIPTYDNNLLILLACAFAFLIFFQLATEAIRSYIVLYLGTNISIQVTSNLFNHMMKLSLPFFEKRDVGDIVTRFESLNKIKDFFTNNFVETIIDGITALSLIFVLFLYGVQIASVVLIFTIMYAAFRLFVYRRFRTLNEQEIIARAAERSNFLENVQNIKTIMTIDAQPIRSANWSNLHAKSVNAGLDVKKSWVFFRTVNGLIFGVENILVVYLLAMSVINGSLTIGMLTAFIAYKRIFTQRMSSLIDKLLEFKMLSLHLERVSEIALESKVEDTFFSANSDEFLGNIKFNEVSYSYDSFSSTVINNINVEIKKGDHIAICGPSGVGKSTFIKLLIGLLDPTSGYITVDGVGLQKFGKKRFRKNISTVLQEDRLYAGSILDNITFFDPNPDHQWLEECCHMVQIHKTIISKAMGYNTMLGQMGDSLSGGEKQRLILARALYRRPKILILDEATSNLDVKTEAFINEVLANMDITRIVIAHRPQAIRNADKIFRLTRMGLTISDKDTEIKSLKDRISGSVTSITD